MNKKDCNYFSAIWSTWFLDRLFTVDEMIDATKQKNKTHKISDNIVKPPNETPT